jgi:hypothetical protein
MEIRRKRKIVMYQDDGICTCTSDFQCANSAAQVKSDLIKIGFVPKPVKSMWFPVQKLIWLGYVIDSEKSILQTSGKRVYKIFDSII